MKCVYELTPSWRLDDDAVALPNLDLEAHDTTLCGFVVQSLFDIPVGIKKAWLIVYTKRPLRDQQEVEFKLVGWSSVTLKDRVGPIRLWQDMWHLLNGYIKVGQTFWVAFDYEETS